MGLTKPRASQIFDIDYKQATRVITVSNVTLVGGAPASVDGVSLSTGDRVLVTGQTTGSENGIYKVSVLGVGSDGTWVRTSDSDQDGEVQAGMIVMVTEGTTYADTQWKLTTNNPIDIGTTALTFEPNSGGGAYGNTQVANYLSSGTVSTDILTTGAISATGNVTGGNIVTLGIVSSAGVSSAGALLPTANVTYDLGSTSLRWNDLWLSNSTIHMGSITVGATETGLTVNSAPVVTETGTGIDLSGNISGGNILTTGLISATGNVSAGNVSGTNITGTLATAAQPNVTSVGTLGSLTVTGNVAAGNVSATLFTGSGASLTNLNGSNISSGTIAAARVATLNQNTTGYAATVSGAAQANITSVGTLTSLAVTGNVSAGNVSGTNITGTLATAAQTNITSVGTLTGGTWNATTVAVAYGGTGTTTSTGTGSTVLSASPTFTGTANFAAISASSTVTGTSFVGVATSAKYADLAEKYLADQNYPAGTVVAIGGEKEVTAAQSGQRAIGVVSTKPAFMMNMDLAGGTYIALKGRVPCKVSGTISKGDRLVAGNNGEAWCASAQQPAGVDNTFAIALENSSGDGKIIEVLVL